MIRPERFARARLRLLFSLPCGLILSSSAGLGGGLGGVAPESSEAYYQFLLGKISRLDGQFGDAADHLNLAAGADDSGAIRVELAETYMRMGDLPRAIEQARLATKKNPEDEDARRALAEAYLAAAMRGSDREGSTALAIAEYQTLVRIAPSDTEARVVLGRLLLQADRAGEALDQFIVLKSSGADPVQAGLLLSRAFLRQGRKEEGEAELQAVLALAPRNYEALISMSQIAEGREDWASASGYYRRLVAIRPADNTLRARLGYALFRSGRKDQAVEALREASVANPSDRTSREMLVKALQAAGRPGEALRELSLLLQYQPDDPLLLIEVGRIHESRSETEAALEAYRRALAAPEAAESGRLTPDARASLVLAIAALELATGDAAGALRTLAGLPEDGSEIGVEALILRARALIGAGRPGEGARGALDAVQRDSKSPRGALVLLEARLAAGSGSDAAAAAVSEFRPASRTPREIAAAAELLRKAHQPRLGISLLEAALAAHPLDPGVQFALGAFKQNIGNFSDSQRYLRRAIELNPQDAQALNYLGYSLAQRGKELVLAESLIRRALEADPDSGPYLDSLGWVLLKQGRLEEAETALLRAGDILAGDGTVREHLGDLYMKKGDPDRALVEWKSAQGMKTEDPKRLRRKIASILKKEGGQ